MTPPPTPTAPAGPRLLLRRLREVLAGVGDPQQRLDNVVRAIAANMVAEVCSVYMLRAGVLELYATEGLRPESVHRTTLRIGEGLVGLIAQHMRPLALSDAKSHPNFAYRSETGEEIYHSLMGVPIIRGGRVNGVLVVQNRTRRHYADDEIEAMQTIAMVLGEMATGPLPGQGGGGESAGQRLPLRLSGTVLNDGMARGVAVLHEPRVVVERHVADDPQSERRRLDEALEALRAQIDRMLDHPGLGSGSEPRDILETYRMFASDRGWVGRLHQGIAAGLTAEAAVERVQVEARARMSEASDAYLRERLHDLEDLANRLLRHLVGSADTAAAGGLPADTVLVARNMGPAELLEYDRSRLRAVVLEEGSATAHVAIVARALGIPMLGRVEGAIEQIDPGDTLVVDGGNLQVFVRPGADMLRAYGERVAVLQARQAAYAALKDAPAVTRDGTRVSLALNAGLLLDLPNLEATGAEGIGLYRTELQFMVRTGMPSIEAQTEYYRRVLEQVGDRPVIFRTLDIGGDKVLPYLAMHDEDNPAMGWRAIRFSLDRPVLLRMQLRALLRASAGRPLRVMFPMVAEVAEFLAARRYFEREAARLGRLGQAGPAKTEVGTMLEVPSLVFQLPALLPLVDFVSIGSNDLMQFLFASDRNNPRLAERYDILSPLMLSLLRDVIRQCDAAGVPVGLCGEAAGRPVEALALLALGLRRLSMPAMAVGPVKAMIRSLELPPLVEALAARLASPEHSLRAWLNEYAGQRAIPL